MKLKKWFLLLLILPFILIGCKSVTETDIELDINGDITKITLKGDDGDFTLEPEFNQQVLDTVDALTSALYTNYVEEAGQCDYGHDIDVTINTSENTTYKIYNVSKLEDETCQPLMFVIADGHQFGYSGEIYDDIETLYNSLVAEAEQAE